MPNPVFPHADLQDSKYFDESPEDPTVRTELEGGYEFTRPRHTRTPRRTYSSGFTQLTQAQKDDLSTFWNTVKGGSVIFDWTNPQTLTTMQVRFTKAPTFKYTGIGGQHRWDVQFEVRTA